MLEKQKKRAIVSVFVAMELLLTWQYNLEYGFRTELMANSKVMQFYVGFDRDYR
jgi:hypothetical protein